MIRAIIILGNDERYEKIYSRKNGGEGKAAAAAEFSVSGEKPELQKLYDRKIPFIGADEPEKN